MSPIDDILIEVFRRGAEGGVVDMKPYSHKIKEIFIGVVSKDVFHGDQYGGWTAPCVHTEDHIRSILGL